MAFSVNTNNEAMAALRMLSVTNAGLATTQERINSGLKVGSARDNASTFAIAQGMRGDIASFKAVSDSLALGQATTEVALSAATQISNTLIDIKAKVTAAQEDNVDRSKIQADITALAGQIDTIIASAEFNGVNLLQSASTDMSVMSGLDAASKITVSAQDIEAVAGNVTGINVEDQSVEMVFTADAEFANNDTITLTTGDGDVVFEFVDDPATVQPTLAENIIVVFDGSASLGENLATFAAAAAEEGIAMSYNETGNLVATHASGITAIADTLTTGDTSGSNVLGGDPSTAITTIDTAISAVTDALASLATDANSLETQADFVGTLTDTLEGGLGQLVDADLAEESARLQALQTKQQLGIQALSIANQQPSAVLSLFR